MKQTYNIVVLDFATNSVCFHDYISDTEPVNEDIEEFLTKELEYNLDEIFYMFNNAYVISVYDTEDNNITNICM